MVFKQNLEFCGVTGLTKTDIEIIKGLLKWSYNTKVASAFNISMAIGACESNVSKRVRYLNSRGIITKSLGGSWYIPDHYKTKILGEFTVNKMDQGYLEPSDKPIETPEELDKLLGDVMKSVDADIKKQNILKHEKQRSKNANTKFQKRIDAKRYDRDRSKNGKL